MKKKWILPFIGCICLVLYSFGHSLFIHGAMHYLAYVAEKEHGIYLHFEKLSGSFGDLKIQNFYVSDHKEISKQSLQLFSPKVNIHYRLNIFSKIFDVDIFLKRPKLFFSKRNERKKEVNIEFGYGNFLTFQPSLQIEKGHLVYENENSQQIEYAVSLNSQFKKKEKLSLILKDPIRQVEELKLNYQKNETSDIEFALDCNQLDLGNMGLIIKKFNLLYNNWDLKKGIAHGHIEVYRKKEKGNKVLGSLNIHEFEVKNNLNQTKAFIDFLALDLTSQSHEKKSAGKMFLKGNSCIEILLKDGSKWLLEDLTGECSLLKHGQLDLHLGWTSKNKAIHFETTLCGDVRILDGLQASVNMQLLTTHSNKANSHIHVAVDHIGPLWNFAHFDLRDITAKEIEFYKSGLFNYFEYPEAPEIKKGNLNSIGKMHFKGYEVQSVEFEKIEIEDLLVTSDPLNLYGQVKNIKGKVAVDFLEKKLLEGIDAEMDLSEGIIHFYGYDKELWKFSDIHTNISCKKGIIEKSLAKGSFAGLVGEIEIDWLSNAEIVKLNFSGNPLSIDTYLPKKIQKGIHKAFSGDYLHFNAGISRYEKGLDINALMKVHHLSESENISFGFKVEKLNQNNNCAIDWKLLGKEALSFAIPNIEESVLSKYYNLNSKNRSGYLLKDGWLHANDLPLKRYIEPFLQISESNTSLNNIYLNGVGSVFGTFDQKGLAITYSVENFVFESDQYKISIPKIVQTFNQAIDLKNQAFHIFEFENGQHYGSVPINNASYLEKNSGLLFYDIDARLNFENENIYANAIKMGCSNVSLEGEFDFLRSKSLLNHAEMGIRIHSIRAGVKDLTNIAKHFTEEFAFADYLMKGQFELDEEAKISIKISPDKTTYLTKIKAIFKDGSFKLPSMDAFLKDVKFHIDYDQESNIFSLSQLEGVLSNSSDGFLEKTYLYGKKLLFSDVKNLVSEFDFKLVNKEKELVRLVGNTSKKNDQLVVSLQNRDSHVGSTFFDHFTLKLENWNQCKEFQCAFKLPLDNLCHDIKTDKHFFSYFLSDASYHMVNKISQMEGNIHVKLGYDELSSQFVYSSSGTNLRIDSYHFDDFLFEGSIKDRSWVIDRLLCDKVSASAEILKELDTWKVNFLGIKYGESFLLGAEGEYDTLENMFRAKINLLETHLEHLNEWPFLSNLLGMDNPKGVIRGNGSFTCLIKNQKIVDYDGLFNLNAKDFEYRGIVFNEIKKFSCQIQKFNGITLRNIFAEIHRPNNTKNKIKCSIEKINYLLPKNSYSIESLNLTIPHHHLNWFSSAVAGKFLSLSSDSKSIIRSMINQGQLNLSFHCEMSPDQQVIKMSLPNGSYHFKGDTLQLTNFLLVTKNDDLTISTGYKFQQKNLWLTLNAKTCDYPSGTLLITEQSPTFKIGLYPSISINWDIHPVHGLNVKDIKGKLAGLTINLTKDEYKGVSENYCNLTGDVSVNVPKGLLFFDRHFMEGLKQNRLFGNFNFKGNFIIAKGYNLKSQFYGSLHANNWAFQGYYLNSLGAHLDYYGDKANFTDLTISDTACSMIVSKLFFQENEEGMWFFNTPKIYVKDLKPTKLKEIEQHSIGKQSSLILNYIQIDNFSGKLANSATWKGVGKLKFANPPKTNLQNTIFSFPHELITRIGLNPAVLTPVTGSIYFNIYDSKFNFTKFEDIYSETKGSKFYLPENTTPSYLDFDGNLNVKVRMKQYNLLFKITELMTVTIKGTLNNPQYSLRKEKNNRKKM